MISIGTKTLEHFVDMTFGREWFDYIEMDIKEKYDIDNPKFKISGNCVELDYIIDWIDHKLSERKWVKYRHLHGVLFELRDCFPDPSDYICRKMVHDSFMFLNKYSEPVYFKMGSFIYNEDEIKQEIYVLLKSGGSEICCCSIPIEDPSCEGRIVLEISVGDAEMHHHYKSGHLVLEIKD